MNIITLLLIPFVANAYTIPNSLIKDNYKLVHHIINKKFHYLPKSVREELKQEAFLGFVKSAQKYDPNKNCKFSTYASYYIVGYALNAIRKYKNYNDRFIISDFSEENYIDYKSLNKFKNKDVYDKMDKENLIDKFYDECESEDKDILYDYYHNKMKQQDIADKYSISKKKVSYKVKKNLTNFKRNNNI